MAKKSAAKGGPQKQCPACGKTMHARTATCACGHVFEAKAPAAPRKSKGGSADTEKAAMAFVLFEQGGNIEKAVKAVEGYSADSLATFIANCGGVEAAKKSLEGLKQKRA